MAAPYDGGRVVAGLFQILLVNADRDRCVRIAQVAVFFKRIADDFNGFLIIAAAAVEQRAYGIGRCGVYGVCAAALQGVHPARFTGKALREGVEKEGITTDFIEV